MKLGIVGAGGYWGPNWVRVLKQLNVLGAVCEQDAQRLEEVAVKFNLRQTGVRLCSSVDGILDAGLAGLLVVTPPATHADVAIRAMNVGMHVLIEKPLAGNLEDCYHIKFESDRLKRKVMVGHTFLYHPAVRKFRECLPMVGKLRTVHTVRANFGLYQDIGLVRDLMPHDFSIFSYLCNGYPSTVKSDVSPHQDIAFVTAMYGDVQCSAYLSWSHPRRVRTLNAVGEKGILEWDLSWSYLLHHRKWATSAGKGPYEHHDEGTEQIEVDDHSEPLLNEAVHFLECIREDKQPFTGIEDGINVVKGLEACR
jgi:predicted dehydrogenase